MRANTERLDAEVTCLHKFIAPSHRPQTNVWFQVPYLPVLVLADRPVGSGAVRTEGRGQGRGSKGAHTTPRRDQGLCSNCKRDILRIILWGFNYIIFLEETIKN